MFHFQNKQNGRQQSGVGLLYDAAGNLRRSESRSDGGYQANVYDAANRATTVTTYSNERTGRNRSVLHGQVLTQTFDGDGHAVKAQETWTTTGVPTQVGSPKYQMWSTVLNSALTEISDAGLEVKTKVFAGGAVIAEQMTFTSNHIEWITADPVTGSSVRLHKTGAFYLDESEEREPLGQIVLAEEPPIEEQQQNYQSAINSAEEPEWQCLVAEAIDKDFFRQPVHCQKAVSEYLQYEIIPGESNPSRVIRFLVRKCALRSVGK